CGIAIRARNRQEQMFRRDVLVLELLGFLECTLERVVQRPAHSLLGKALNFRQPAKFAFHVAAQHFLTNAESREQWRHHSIRLACQCGKQVQRRNFLIFVAGGNFLRVLQRFLRLYCQFFESHHDELLPPFFEKWVRKKGAGAAPAPCCSTRTKRRIAFAEVFYRPATTAAVCPPTFTLICLGFASSRFGMLSVSTPSL